MATCVQGARADTGNAARVNVSVLYRSFDTAGHPWPTSVTPAAVSFRSGSAWLGRSQKDGLPSRLRGVSWTARLTAINSRTGEGQPGRCPFKLGASARPKRIGDGG